MLCADDDTDRLLSRAADGSGSAADALLERHRERLAGMIRLRMDHRLVARLDPSDVVQDVLAEAHTKLLKFAATRPMSFYPWLRAIAWERLIQIHRLHVGAHCRSVKREEQGMVLPNGSEMLLAERLVASGANPSRQAVCEELRQRVRAALNQLSQPAREIVTLRHLEEMPFNEIEAVLGISEAAVYSRYRRAMEQLALLLKSDA
jgi:RNA polymerase sigma-70 factor (ECF subfamily)